jgi:hypothetical protein
MSMKTGIRDRRDRMVDVQIAGRGFAIDECAANWMRNRGLKSATISKL